MFGLLWCSMMRRESFQFVGGCAFEHFPFILKGHSSAECVSGLGIYDVAWARARCAQDSSQYWPRSGSNTNGLESVFSCCCCCCREKDRENERGALLLQKRRWRAAASASAKLSSIRSLSSLSLLYCVSLCRNPPWRFCSRLKVGEGWNLAPPGVGSAFVSGSGYDFKVSARGAHLIEQLSSWMRVFNGFAVLLAGGRREIRLKSRLVKSHKLAFLFVFVVSQQLCFDLFAPLICLDMPSNILFTSCFVLLFNVLFKKKKERGFLFDFNWDFTELFCILKLREKFEVFWAK
jgi:hypothetical protein